MPAKQPTNAQLQQQLDELESRLADTLRERDQLVESAQRLKADFDNFRKRTARDQKTIAAQGHGGSSRSCCRSSTISTVHRR